MNTIDQLIADIEALRKVLRQSEESDNPVRESVVVSYLLANQSVIESYLRLAFKEHTAEERKQLSDARDQDGSYRYILHGGSVYHTYELCAMAITGLQEFVEADMVDISDDDLEVLVRGLQYARCFEARPATTPLQHSPVVVRMAEAD